MGTLTTVSAPGEHPPEHAYLLKGSRDESRQPGLSQTGSFIEQP
jgi:hypothetical protein